jgi:hypothetical protein
MPTDRKLEQVNEALDRIKHTANMIYQSREKYRRAERVDDRLTYLEEQMDLIAWRLAHF